MKITAAEQKKRKLPYVRPVVTVAKTGEFDPRVGSVVTTPEGQATPAVIFTGSGS